MSSESEPQFNISASVVRQLGEELVSDEVTAILELVKNAYDADATYANIIIDTEAVVSESLSSFQGQRGYIIIEDDGHGMNMADVERGWLTISISSKRGMKRSGRKTASGRTPLGDKGLGRLSTQKLGQNLDLFSRRVGESPIHVSFTWADFNDDVKLSAVPVIAREVDNFDKDRGTRLLISGLTNPEALSGEEAISLVRRLSQLVSPFSEFPTFLMAVTINGVQYDLETISSYIRDAAMSRFKIDYSNNIATIIGAMRLHRLRSGRDSSETQKYDEYIAPDRGKDFFQFLDMKSSGDLKGTLSYREDEDWFIEFNLKMDPTKLKAAAFEPADAERGREAGAFADPGIFSAELDEYVLRLAEADEISAPIGRQAELRAFVKRNAGIRLFRDGFGIRPYGLEGNDWLELGKSQTSGGSHYDLRPANVIGYIAITEAANGHLKEKTDREGLVKSPYTDNFFLICRESIRRINRVLEYIRRSYVSYRTEQSKKLSGVEGIEDALQVIERAGSRARKLRSSAAQLRSNTQVVANEVARVSKIIQDEPLFSSPAEKKFIEFKNQIEKSLIEASQMAEQLSQYAEESANQAAVVDHIHGVLEKYQQRLSDLLQLAGVGVQAEIASHEIRNLLIKADQRLGNFLRSGAKSENGEHIISSFGQFVAALIGELRVQLEHISPSLRFQRKSSETIQVSSFLEDQISHFQTNWNRKGIKSVVLHSGKDFFVRVNRGRLTQIIDNILHNAEYWVLSSDRGLEGHPTIFLDYDSPFIRIWDNGPGIDERIESSIFQAFQSGKPDGEGRGLGLYIVEELLTLMGGAIRLLSQRNLLDRRYIFELNMSKIISEKA